MPGTRPWTWPRLVAVTVAKALLVGLIGLAAWGALPAAIGWHPTTVSSGSMLPRLHVGDVAVSRPLGSGVPPLTSVLLFHDPDHPGRLRMHRFVRVDDDGLLVTRGDANREDDSTPVALSAVIGIGTLRVPWVALPVVWLRGGRWAPLVGVVAALGLLLVVAASGHDRDFGDDDPGGAGAGSDDSDGSDNRDGSDDQDGSADQTDPSDTAPSDTAPSDTAPSDTAPSDTAPSDTAPSDTAPSDTAPPSGLPETAAPPTVPGWFATLARRTGAGAGAASRGTTSTSASPAAAICFTCANAVAAYAPALWVARTRRRRPGSRPPTGRAATSAPRPSAPGCPCSA